MASERGELPGVDLGVGPVRAAAGMARWLAALQPTAVVLVGSAGVYVPGRALGRAVVGRRLSWADGVSALRHGYAPLPPPPIRVPDALTAAFHLPAVDVVTVASITTSRELLSRIGRPGGVEHLETYGAAWACQEAGVPFVPVLGIANRVGPNAHDEWVHHRESAERAARQSLPDVSWFSP